MEKYVNFDKHYQELLGDIYPQPPDAWHTAKAKEVIDLWIPPLGWKSVLDVGCGVGFAQEFFDNYGVEYFGVCLGQSDYDMARELRRSVSIGDFNFLDFPDESFDLIFSRHSLEHSPFPILSLMEWHRVSKAWLCLVVPRPEYVQWTGRNHLSVANREQVIFWLDRAGWRVIKEDDTCPEEYRFLCLKMFRRMPFYE